MAATIRGYLELCFVAQCDLLLFGYRYSTHQLLLHRDLNVASIEEFWILWFLQNYVEGFKEPIKLFEPCSRSKFIRSFFKLNFIGYLELCFVAQCDLLLFGYRYSTHQLLLHRDLNVASIEEFWILWFLQNYLFKKRYLLNFLIAQLARSDPRNHFVA